MQIPERAGRALALGLLALLIGACGAPAGVPAGEPTVAANSAAAATAYPAPATAAAGAPAATSYPAPPTSAAAPTGASGYPIATAVPPPEPTVPPAPPPPTNAGAYPAPAEPAGTCLPDDLPPAQPPAVAPSAPITRTAQAPISRYGFEVIGTFPHDRGAFTEGLQYVDGALYEGTGLNGKSELRRVALATGAVEQRCALQGQYFGEGVTVLGDRIYQLTWQNQTGFVYDRGSFRLLKTFGYPSEGWGLTNDGQRLIMSDGTARIHFLDPQSLQETGHIDVYDDRGPVVRLNELEYVRGEIYANVWQTDLIARIDPQSGQVVGWIDLGGLLGAEDRREPVDVLNGIAYDAAGDRLFVTGKLWPKLFEIRLVPAI